MKKLLGLAIGIGGFFAGASTAVELDYVSYSGAKAAPNAVSSVGDGEIATLPKAESGDPSVSPAAKEGPRERTASSAVSTVTLSQISADKAGRSGGYGLSAAILYDFSDGYFESSIYSNYFNLPSMIRNNVTYSSSDEERVDAFKSADGDDDAQSSKLAGNAFAQGKGLRPARQWRPKIFHSRRIMRQVAGCARCGRQETTPSPARAKTLISMMSANMVGKAARRDHVSAESKQREDAARTFQMGFLSPSI